MNSSRPYATDKAWNWLRPNPRMRDYLDMEPRGGNTFEVVVKDGCPTKVYFHFVQERKTYTLLFKTG